MKNLRAGLVGLLFLLFAFGVTSAEIEFNGVLDPGVTVTIIDSVTMKSPDMTFPTPGWGWDSLATGIDTFVFIGVTAWPETLVMHGTSQGFPFHRLFLDPPPDTWIAMFLGIVIPWVLFYGDYGAVEEPKPVAAAPLQLAVSPSVVTGQMTVRLQPVGTGRQVVEIRDAVGNVIRSLDFTAAAEGPATATWNREDDRGRLVPEGVYFCRYAASDVIAVRKVLVAR
jgi:hypothetical protein